MNGANNASPFAKDLLLGFETSDDAAVLRVNDDVAAVLTVDFLTPLVDDPYTFGRIAAANALSDVFAMGAKAVCALNILALDVSLGNETARDVLAGGADAVAEAGALIVGGHSIDDTEPKYGLCVYGMVDPHAIVKNGGAEVGDILYLTKPLGVGVLSSAYKIGEIGLAEFQPAIDAMSELNKAGGEAMLEAGVHAATDVTGFGLAGHLHEMLAASDNAGAELDWDALPMFDGVWDLACAYCRPNRTFSIMDFAAPFVEQGSVDDEEYDNRMAILCDPQTSGGLICAIPPDQAETFEREFERRSGRLPARIGRVVEDAESKIRFADAT